MKLKINSEIIKSKRLDRAWSQEHLAHISGLSIRTIQRVEITGTASLETLKALSATLEIPIDDLKTVPNHSGKKAFNKLSRNGVVATIVAVAFSTYSLFMGNSVLADQVLLDLDIAVDGEILGHFGDLPVVSDEKGVFIFDEIAKLNIVPTITDTDDILISIEIYEFNGNEYALVSSPKALFTREGDGAIETTTNNGSSYRVSIVSKVE